MKGWSPSWRQAAALAAVLLVALANAWALQPELSIGKFQLNDSVFHYAMAERMVQAYERGENPLDCWVSEWSLGFPVSRTYQPLGHLLVAFAYLALGKTLSLSTVFLWTEYLLLALLPITVYVSGRWLGLPTKAAVSAAVLSPLISSNGLFGIEYGSYVWRGSGLFTQAVAMHLLLLSLGLGLKSIRQGGRWAGAGIALGLTFLAHFIYGYIGAVSLCLFAAIPSGVEAGKRLARLALIGGVAFSVSAFELLPLIIDSPWLNHSRWEPAWKWDSFGAGGVLKYVVSGELLDFGRPPILSLLALLGAAVCVTRWRRFGGAKEYCCAALISGAVLWLLLFFGRPTWGVLYSLIGASDIQLHRLSGAVHSFCIFLAGIGLAQVWDGLILSRLPYRRGLAVAAVVLILAFPTRERIGYLAKNDEWGRANAAAGQTEAASVSAVVKKLQDAPGRVYPGLAASWGKEFRVGDVPLYATLAVRHIPAVAFLYHAMALTSDIMVEFDERNPAHYRLFNVSTVLSDNRSLPSFVAPAERLGRFQISRTDSGGYFDVVRVPYAVSANKQNSYDTSHVWLGSDWIGKQSHILLDFGQNAPKDLPRLTSGQALPALPALPPPGSVQHEMRNGERYEADVIIREPSYVLFKMTYHPNWQAIVDGVQQPTAALTPGFIGARLSPGQHHVEFRYEPNSLKNVLFVAGVVCVVLISIGRRNALGRIEESISRWMVHALHWFSAPLADRWRTAAGLALLALPVCVPLFTADLLSGHDAIVYNPRLTEFHENIASGSLLPRWAPDLELGAGQPLFVFTPPLTYYLAEPWRMAGLSPVAALNIEAAIIVLGSAFAMFLLGDSLFGRMAGFLAAAAYVYSPYFHVDLYVRHALSEFTAFPFFPLTLYGFTRYALSGNRRFLLLGSGAYAAVFLSHNAAALIFTPVLAAFLAFLAWKHASPGLFLRSLGGAVVGVGVAAFVWMPVLAEMQFIHIERSVAGYFNYANHFVLLPQLFSTKWGYGFSVPGFHDDISFSLGWGHALVVLIVGVAVRRTLNTDKRQWVFFLSWTLLLLIALMMPFSLWVWDYAPLLKQVQFPWRLLAPISVCMALMASLAGAAIDAGAPKRRIYFWTAMALLILPNLRHVGPERYWQIDPILWNAQTIAQSGLETTSSYELEPRWVTTRSPFSVDKLRVVSGSASVEESSHSPVRLAAKIHASSDSLVEAALLYFPGWAVRVDDAPVQTIVSDNGRIRFRIPPGDHRLDLQFRRTAIRFMAETVSLGALFVMAALFIKTRTSDA